MFRLFALIFASLIAVQSNPSHAGENPGVIEGAFGIKFEQDGASLSALGFGEGKQSSPGRDHIYRRQQDGDFFPLLEVMTSPISDKVIGVFATKYYTGGLDASYDACVTDYENIKTVIYKKYPSLKVFGPWSTKKDDADGKIVTQLLVSKLTYDKGFESYDGNSIQITCATQRPSGDTGLFLKYHLGGSSYKKYFDEIDQDKKNRSGSELSKKGLNTEGL